jgi:hypothetical protein
MKKISVLLLGLVSLLSAMQENAVMTLQALALNCLMKKTNNICPDMLNTDLALLYNEVKDTREKCKKHDDSFFKNFNTNRVFIQTVLLGIPNAQQASAYAEKLLAQIEVENLLLETEEVISRQEIRHFLKLFITKKKEQIISLSNMYYPYPGCMVLETPPRHIVGQNLFRKSIVYPPYFFYGL